MTINYTNISEKNLSQGIDARSPENQVKEGFVKDLQNADIIENKLVKRTGYQGYSGNIPVRVKEVEYKPTEDKIVFTLDGSISLEETRSSPLVVYGTRSDGSSFLPGNVLSKYYPGFTVPLRSTLTAPSGTITVPADETGIQSSDIFVEFVESTSSINASFQKAIADSINISTSIYDVTVDYQIYQNGSGIVYFADKTPVTGSSYVHSVGINYPSVSGNSTTSIPIPASTHGLQNYNIIGQIYEVDAQAIASVTTMTRVIPDSLTISNTGDVTVTVTNSDSTTKYYKIVLSVGEIGNLASGIVTGNSSNSVTISSVESPWVFTGIYLEQTAGGTKELVIADSISYDDVNKELTLSFTNNASDARNFIVYYQYGTRVLNRLEVTDTSVFTADTDIAPQMTLWGLDHSEIYIGNDKKQGQANHIDSYRRSGEQRVITGLGGNLFSSKTYSEVASDYLYTQLFPNLQARTDSAEILAPVFWETGELPGRSKGYVTTDISGTNQVQVTRIEYTGNTSGNTRVYLNTPGIAAFTSSGASTTVAAVIQDRDYLDMSNMSYKLHNGSFRIYSVHSVAADELVLNIEVPDNAADYDDAGLCGDAGIYTDRLTWLSTPTFTTGDRLIGADLELSVVYSNTETVVSGVVTRMEVPAGLVFTAVRTSGLISSRNRSPFLASNVTNLVRGDMLSYTGIDRLLRVKYINTLDTVAVSLVGDGTTTTVTLGSGTTDNLTSGQKIQIVGSDDINGIYTIVSIESVSDFTISSTLTGSDTGSLVGKTFEVDEELEWQDTSSDANFFRVERRWVPVEAPFHSYDMPADSYFNHFSAGGYSEQAPLRSVMVADNMYFTNGLDEVRKFDGSSVYMAGLPAWQPGLFITQDTAATGKIVNTNPEVVAQAREVKGSIVELKVALGEQSTFKADDRVYLTAVAGTGLYTVKDTRVDATHGYVSIIAGSTTITVNASSTIQKTDVYSYYYRLNMVDSNKNIIASAATGSDDHRVELAGDAAIKHKIVGLPPLKDLDYNKIELQIYRTKANQAAPFYLLTTLPVSFDKSKGYVEFTDAFSDSTLVELDGPQTAFKGAELGINISEPVRAKYLTSAGNRLVLGNLLDYPEFDIQLVGNSTITANNLIGMSFTFRRNSGTSLTTFQDRATYELRASAAYTVSGISIGTNEFTVTTSGTHAEQVGNWIYLTYSSVATSGRDLKYSGWWKVKAVTTNTLTISLPGASAATSYPDRMVTASVAGYVPLLIPDTTVDGNMGMANGNSAFNLFDVGRFLSMAINATMRQETLDGFKPWLTARGGGDLSKSGNIIVRKPFADLDGEEMSLNVVHSVTGLTVFVNGVLTASNVLVTSQNKSLPSRILISYPNYPEAFDAPFTVSDTNSDSAVDVNSSDGQEITGIIPFFGETAFGAAQQGGVIVVFKTNSIYLVDIAQKAAGNNPVQRLESQGLGCTAPYSIAVTKDGIMFANESGIYALRKNLSIEYVGRFMERNWKDRISLDDLAKAQGHHYGIGRAYKLSVPILGTENSSGITDNSEVYVYNHTSEQDTGFGAWGRYTNHPVTGWANLGQDAFFSSTAGRVFSLRRTGGTDDYRDDSSPIEFSVQTRSWDFGAPGTRKIMDAVLVDFKSRKEDTTGTELAYALDLEEEYTPSTTAKLNTENRNTGINDQIPKTIDTVRYKLSRRRAVYTSVQISNATLDEPIEVTGITFAVGALDEKGIKTAEQTSKKK